MKIDLLLTKLKELEDHGGYRFHLAKPLWEQNFKHCPLQDLARGDEVWKGWQYWKKGEKFTDRFPKKYVVSFAQISGDRFLFGGIFEVVKRYDDHYDVELKNHHKNLIGRLVVKCQNGTGRSTTFTPKRILERLTMTEIYPTRYTGERFQSINTINHDFYTLETIFKNELADWKTALSKVKGIYLLTDKSTGKHYIGSAYGDNGIWGRWSNYIWGYHGGNKQLVNLVKNLGEDYFKKNFKFTVLETMGSSVTDDEIVQRESLWKNKLMSKDFGYNSN